MSNYWTDNRIIEKYTNILGSKYAAIMYVAKTSRKIAEENNNVISHSSALNYVVTGERPKILDSKIDLRSYEDKVFDNALDILKYVDDEDVCKAVVSSIEESRKLLHLIYVYKNVDDDPRMSRIRILCRLIWEDANTAL